MRQHCIGTLAPGGTVQITVNVTDPTVDRIRVNRLTVDAKLPGAGATPYPWRGTYFREAPVTFEAIPAPGRRFAGWTGIETTNRVATVNLDHRAERHRAFRGGARGLERAHAHGTALSSRFE